MSGTSDPSATESCFRPPAYTVGGRLRLRARNLATTSAARLRRAAARAAGDDGLSTACALIDMIGTGTPPIDWPVSELIEMLDGETAREDRQVRRLLNALRRIEADIDTSMLDESDALEIARRRAA